MKKVFSYSVRTFRFKRWNRKGYSAFMSFGKQISIGRLHAEVANGLLRNKHLRCLLLTNEISKFFSLNLESDDDSDGGGLPDLLERLLENIVKPAGVYPAGNILFSELTVNPIFFIMKSIGFFIFIQI
ncbi:MAG: hypothetical protein IKO90_06730 [Bacteroidales bacterium]|nr:hypothetical protein [Bacteroidales bacterium]